MLPSLSRHRCTVNVRRPLTTNGSFAAIEPASFSSAARRTVTPEPGPVPGPVATLHPILEQIEDCAAAAGLSTPVFSAAKDVFDKALADGWGDLDIACVHDQISGAPAQSQEEPS